MVAGAWLIRILIIRTCIKAKHTEGCMTGTLTRLETVTIIRLITGQTNKESFLLA
jgi:hypothetical protein